MVFAKRAINNSYVMRFVSGLARTHAIQRIDCINTRSFSKNMMLRGFSDLGISYTSLFNDGCELLLKV